MRLMQPKRQRRGIFLMDLLVAMAMAIALLMAMTVAISTLHRGERRLAESRAGTRRLEAALWTLQAGGVPDAQVAVERLPGDRPDRRVWVRVSLPATQERAAAGPGQSLVGLVPAERLPEGGGR